MNRTRHAIIRSQQRGIKESRIEIIQSFGTRKRKPGGVYEQSLTAKDKQRAEQYFKKCLQELDKIRNTAIIVDKDATIITAYHKK